MDTTKEITNLLPGYNCGACGSKKCDAFAFKLQSNSTIISKCPFIHNKNFNKTRIKIKKLIDEGIHISPQKPKGLIDNIEADFILFPLENEPSCRETLSVFCNVSLKSGEIIRYRPLGCPITHFAKIVSTHYGLITVHIVGPSGRLGKTGNFTEIGICMVLSFSGRIEGKLPEVGQTVKFLPHHCMMGKVHSGIIVNLENENVIIDCIDLKVWEHAQIKTQ